MAALRFLAAAAAAVALATHASALPLELEEEALAGLVEEGARSLALDDSSDTPPIALSVSDLANINLPAPVVDGVLWWAHWMAAEAGVTFQDFINGASSAVTAGRDAGLLTSDQASTAQFALVALDVHHRNAEASLGADYYSKYPYAGGPGYEGRTPPSAQDLAAAGNTVVQAGLWWSHWVAAQLGLTLEAFMDLSFSLLNAAYDAGVVNDGQGEALAGVLQALYDHHIEAQDRLGPAYYTTYPYAGAQLPAMPAMEPVA